ncbi:MAG: CoA ester lyase [Burkholderiaceae bacterium]|nr:CoA ester lyase [Burkholderiaceae bacterium]
MTAPSNPVAVATTFLFVPATRPERFGRAHASGAGIVIVDLEDAVPPEARDTARAKLASALDAMPTGERARTLVRINALGTPWHAADVAAARAWTGAGLAGIVLPKADAAEALAALSSTLGARAQIVPLIESGAGLDTVDSLATAPGVTRLAFGHLDFMADLGMACEGDEPELLPARFALVRASHRAGLAPPIDGVTTDTQDIARMAHDAARSLRMGFGGKLCIHPDQIAPVRDAFRPGAGQLDWSRRVLERAEQGHALFTLDGRMVDAPVIALARRVVARA